MSSQKQNVTMKFSDVNVKQITIEAVKMGRDTVPLLRYGPDKKNLFIQGPWIKMSQYGVPPGETLSNGAKNEFYQGEESRRSLRLPVDTACSVQLKPKEDPELTNSDEIEAFIGKLKEIDSLIKNTPMFMTLADVDSDNKEKYNPIYRKPVKPKKTSANPKEKYYSMKLKLDVDNKSGNIKTEFISIDGDTGDKTTINGDDGFVTVDQIDKLVSYNSEVCPLFQLVKIWTQDKGDWGVTLKLKKCRVKKYTYGSDASNAEFLESDEEGDSAPVKVASNPVTKLTPTSVDDSDRESDEDTKPVAAKPVTAKPVATTGSKGKQVTQIAQVASDSDSESGSESESESEETVKPVTKPPAKKAQKPESDVESEEEVKPIKPRKGKK